MLASIFLLMDAYISKRQSLKVNFDLIRTTKLIVYECKRSCVMYYIFLFICNRDKVVCWAYILLVNSADSLLKHTNASHFETLVSVWPTITLASKHQVKETMYSPQSLHRWGITHSESMERLAYGQGKRPLLEARYNRDCLPAKHRPHIQEFTLTPKNNLES